VDLKQSTNRFHISFNGKFIIYEYYLFPYLLHQQVLQEQEAQYQLRSNSTYIAYK
jgi:hypothetical protein